MWGTVIFTLTVMIFFSLVGCNKADKIKQEQPAVTTNQPAASTAKKLFGSKSGIITYQAQAMGMPMSQTFYFDNYGEKEARYSLVKIEIMKTVSETETVEIKADGYRIKYNLKDKKGTKSKAITSIAGAAGMPDVKNLSKEMMNQYKYKELGEKEILGKKCKGISMNAMNMDIEAWTWDNIPIMTKMIDKNGKIFTEITATKIETDVPIPADKFTVPAGIEIKEN